MFTYELSRLPSTATQRSKRFLPAGSAPAPLRPLPPAASVASVNPPRPASPPKKLSIEEPITARTGDTEGTGHVAHPAGAAAGRLGPGGLSRQQQLPGSLSETLPAVDVKLAFPFHTARAQSKRSTHAQGRKAHLGLNIPRLLCLMVRCVVFFRVLGSEFSRRASSSHKLQSSHRKAGSTPCCGPRTGAACGPGCDAALETESRRPGEDRVVGARRWRPARRVSRRPPPRAQAGAERSRAFPSVPERARSREEPGARTGWSRAFPSVPERARSEEEPGARTGWSRAFPSTPEAKRSRERPAPSLGAAAPARGRGGRM